MQHQEREDRHRESMESKITECEPCYSHIQFLCICLRNVIILKNHSFPGDPSSDPSIDGDPFKTLFVGRIVSELTKIITIYSRYENIVLTEL